MNPKTTVTSLTSRKRDCISRPPVYLDAVQVRPHYSTQSTINCKMPFSKITATVFSLPSFRQRSETGTIYTNKSVGTNGAYLERALQGTLLKASSHSGNQFGPSEKDDLLLRSGPHQPWTLQVDQYCVQYARHFLGEMCAAFGNLTVRPALLHACEFYAEIPLFNLKDNFDE